MLITSLFLFCLVAIGLTIFLSKKTDEQPSENQVKNKLLFYFGIMAVPIIALSMYFVLGDPRAVSSLEGTTKQDQQFDPQNHLDQIKQLLAEKPNDPSLLAQISRIYMMVGKFELAVQSARRLVSLKPADPTALVQLADALAMVSGGKITEEIFDILGVVLSIDKANPVAMTLLGIGHEQRGQNNEALNHWRKAEALLPNESPLKKRLKEMIVQVTQNPETNPIVSEQTISVTVSLSPELKDAFKRDSTLFVMIKNEGLKPPISVIKIGKPEFPAQIDLTDENSMLQGVSVEDFDMVHAVARVSQSGGPLPQRGDLQGRSIKFDPKTTKRISIVIKKIIE